MAPLLDTQAAKPNMAKLWPFALWLACFYSVWASIVLVGGLWQQVAAHWPIAAAMAAGSYFAGSTPMGGGTVGFPVLVLLFDQPASLGRNFGLAVQSIGMTSASIYILAARRTLDWHLLRPALLGSLIGTPLGAAFIAPYAPDLAVKLLFAIIWCSFGIMHFIKLGPLINAHGKADAWHGVDRPAGLLIGLTGGIVAATTGVGIDMMIYAVLVLIYRADLKIAIPTSVILMAFSSIVGITSNVLLMQVNPGLYNVAPEVFYNWLAAAPVVALGAPFGAMVVDRLPRAPTLLIVSTLCIGQFFWTVLKERVSGWALLMTIAGLVATNLVFHVMFKIGERRKLARQTV
jgi:uncharacterized membrane protein YfcA